MSILVPTSCPSTSRLVDGLLDASARRDLESLAGWFGSHGRRAPYDWRSIGTDLHARTMKLHLILILAASLLGACGDPKEPSQPETPVASGPVLAAFVDEGPIALEVDGVPVPKATLERYLALWKVRRPQTSDKTLIREAIEEGVVPIAAMYAAFSESDIAQLSARAWAAHGRLKSGEQWDVVLADTSDDPNKAVAKGSIGIRRRLAVPGLASPSAEIEQRAFEMELDAVSEPFCTEKGVQIVTARNEVRLPDQSEAELQREIFTLLFAWGADYRSHLAEWTSGKSDEEVEAFKTKLKGFQEQMKRRIRKAKVRIVDESYRDVVYPFRLRNP